MSLYPVEEDVKAILAPFESALLAVHRNAWARWEKSPHRPMVVFGRTLPTLVYEFIAAEAEALLAVLPGVRKIEQIESVKYLFGDRLLLRFKKGDRMGMGHNVDTEAERRYTDPRLPFPDFPDVWKVEACWFPNMLKTRLDRVAIVARDFDVRIWSYDLGAEAASVPLPVDLPIVPIPPERRRPLVAVKDATARRKKPAEK